MTLEITPSNIKINNRQGNTKFDNSNRILFHKYVQEGTAAIGYLDASQPAGAIPALGPNDFYTLDIEFTSYKVHTTGESTTTYLLANVLNKTFSCQGPIPTIFMYNTNAQTTPPAVNIYTEYLFFGVVNGVLVGEIYKPGFGGEPSTDPGFCGSVPYGVTFNYTYRVYTYG